MTPEIMCIPGSCPDLKVHKKDDMEFCFCNVLKRYIKGDECIKFPKGCPYEGEGK